MKSSDTESWERQYYQAGGGDAFLFFTVFGAFKEFSGEFRLARSRYRSNGIPEGVELWRARKPEEAAYIDSYLDGPVGRRLKREDPELFREVSAASGCIVVRGCVPDPETLDYLRDVVGLLTHLLDVGGTAVLDLLTLQWWRPEEWRQKIFEPGVTVPNRHVAILTSQEEGQDQSVWVHTRGMRKFGRPDLSIRRVQPFAVDAAVEVCNRFIAAQAFGDVISEGQEIQIASLPERMTCHHGGVYEDPNYNNVHVEIRRPD